MNIPFFPSDVAQFFVGSRFNRYSSSVNIHEWCKYFFHFMNVRIDFWFLQADCTIYIADLPPLFLQHPRNFL